MEIVFLISWVIGILFCILFTMVAWQTKDKEIWDSLGFVWLVMMLTGWVTGIATLVLMLYIVFVRPRFEE